MKSCSSLLIASAAAAALAAVAVLPSPVSADIYLHYPPGSNNRLNENNRNVQTNNRLFDSQDNNRGGYLVGDRDPLAFYAGSQVPIQWTTQHSCGTEQDNCEVIIQYMVSGADQANGVKSLRDGTTTTRMPANGDANPQFGRHESRAYYDKCVNTVRDKGLFIADQNMNNNVGRSATRQNANGNQNGNECAEERDYYPTAVPSPWRDVAIITNNAARCAAYKSLSQNVAPVYQCDGVAGNNVPITEIDCINKNGDWNAIAPKGLAAPDCILNSNGARDNSLSIVSGSNGTAATYMWTLPTDAAGKDVVMRIRYNISTGEYYDPKSGAPEFKNAAGQDIIDARYNAQKAGGVTSMPVWEKLGLKLSDVQATIKAGTAAAAAAAAKAAQAAGKLTAAVTTRGYVISNNPNVDMFGPLLNNGNSVTGVGKIRVQLAYNLAQWGRTFEDRSHVFSVLSSASNPVVKSALAAGKKVINVGIMGHRGNQVQSYPALEVQYTQKQYTAQPGDVVHFQWSLSSKNPQNNAVGQNSGVNDGISGQTNGVDTANVVMLGQPTYERLNAIEGGNPFQFGALGRMRPASIADPSTSFLGLDAATLKTLATGGKAFNSGPIAVTKEGDFAFMSTLSSLANVRTTKALLKVRGSGYASFMQSAAVKAAAFKQLSLATASAPTEDVQRLAQSSAQAPGSNNINAQAAQLAQAGIAEPAQEPTASKLNVGLIVGVVVGIAAAVLLTIVAYTLYVRHVSAKAAKSAYTGSAYATSTPVGVQQPSLPVTRTQPAQQWQTDRARMQQQTHA